ncbi:MAG: glycine cleavage system aminomethyltransferase GcvT [SAR202 cluster bacterium]|nr:glycine cleavage system aminomethyltransferase GcvT [SAR202 cluster bacterium]
MTKNNKTPLYQKHIASKARIVDFGGWDMPVQYESILKEVEYVRTDVGMFDVSHMGRVNITGKDSENFLNRVLSFNTKNLKPGRIKYGVICNKNGGIIDDCVTLRKNETDFMIIPNASNTNLVLDWFNKVLVSDKYQHSITTSKWTDISIDNSTTTTAMIAIQGPQAENKLSNIINKDLSKIKYFGSLQTTFDNQDILICRTGYTGEDGFELICSAEFAPVFWDALKKSQVSECGLGSRDILRLEAGLLLMGNDMNSNTNPFEVGLGKFIDLSRINYIASDALKIIQSNPTNNKLVGFVMEDKGIPRHGYQIKYNDQIIGQVTSGGVSPTLDKIIGLGYIAKEFSTLETKISIEIRNKNLSAKITKIPFYIRRKNV